MNIRIGYGFDLHRLVVGRPCIVGGVEIPFDKGLDGHSDADVLLHAIADALLGSLALGDIGTHFPDDDKQWEGADSSILLSKVYEKVRELGYHLVNVDVTVIAEQPKLNPYVDTIRRSVASILDSKMSQISIKATTHEKLDGLGQGEGMACHAVVLIKSVD